MSHEHAPMDHDIDFAIDVLKKSNTAGAETAIAWLQCLERDVIRRCNKSWGTGHKDGRELERLSSGSTSIAADGGQFQRRVQPWMMECFGEAISNDLGERNHRFFEESTELVQSTGMTRSEAHQLVDYVFDRPIGEPVQEVGGVMVTLAALCLAAKMDMHVAGEMELARIWTKVEVIRAKQAAKPKHSPLPQHVAPHPCAAIRNAALDVDGLANEIRRVDGNHSLGAGALAEALLPFLQSSPAPKQDVADQWYLQDTRSYVGNDVMWWAKDGNGYTTDVSKAHVYDRASAFRQVAMRGTDRAWPKAYIDGKTRPAVDMQYINHAEAIAAQPSPSVSDGKEEKC
ncbi:MAG: hypothetical protein GAK35_02642 [Herbaspirillum frisingense]|uniref:Uncharacterized protein n=1 Tax=Herbaspirillum frisingense TaxID=92645 RepID=A0A7V8FVR1_9BURK|nr:MAG: hypothetical protein GAK35_02642 [Herbaspirillum frisingense]